jgi:hypothetical protein
MTKQDDKPDNMELWNKVCKTDPSLTKEVDQRGGFTAICAQYQLRLATEQWGPYGRFWGIGNIKWDYIGPAEKPIEIVLTAQFTYRIGADTISFELSVDRAYRTGDDQRKKMLTDLRSKALSTLGFNSDVFEGKFDDHAYVRSLWEKKKQQDKKPDAPPPKQDEPSADKGGEIDLHGPATGDQKKEIWAKVGQLNPDLEGDDLKAKIFGMLQNSQWNPEELTAQQAGFFLTNLNVMLAKARK